MPPRPRGIRRDTRWIKSRAWTTPGSPVRNTFSLLWLLNWSRRREDGSRARRATQPRHVVCASPPWAMHVGFAVTQRRTHVSRAPNRATVEGHVASASRSCARRSPRTSLDGMSSAAPAAPTAGARRSSISGAVSETSRPASRGSPTPWCSSTRPQGPVRDDPGPRPLTRLARLRRAGRHVLA